MEEIKIYHHRHNPKVIALLIEIGLLVAWLILLTIFYSVGVSLPNVLLIVITAVLIFALLLTLSLIRYDAVRDLRHSGFYGDKEKEKIFLNLYDDSTTLMGHDINEEKGKDDY